MCSSLIQHLNLKPRRGAGGGFVVRERCWVLAHVQLAESHFPPKMSTINRVPQVCSVMTLSPKWVAVKACKLIKLH